MAISPGKLGEVLKAVLVRDLVGTPREPHRVRRDGGAPHRRGRARRAGRARRDRAAARAASPGRRSVWRSSPPWSPSGRQAVGRQVRRLLPARLVEPARLFVHGGRALLGDARAGGGARPLRRLVVLRVPRLLPDPARASASSLPLRAATFVYAFASLAGAVSMLPGGLGVAEGSLTALLAGFGTPLPEAAAATLLVRSVTLWLAVALGASSPLAACAFPGAAGTRPACARQRGSRRASVRSRAQGRRGSDALRLAADGVLSSPLWRLPRRPGNASTSSGG